MSAPAAAAGLAELELVRGTSAAVEERAVEERAVAAEHPLMAVVVLELVRGVAVQVRVDQRKAAPVEMELYGFPLRCPSRFHQLLSLPQVAVLTWGLLTP
jgi:hypothetical protein